MRAMSFALTTPQMRARTKDVTRRLGTSWWDVLSPGVRLKAIEKGQGLKKGEKQVVICEIEVLAVSREPLDEIVRDRAYGKAEMIREGFPGRDPEDFVQSFSARCDRDALVTRIAFCYAELVIFQGGPASGGKAEFWHPTDIISVPMKIEGNRGWGRFDYRATDERIDGCRVYRP